MALFQPWTPPVQQPAVQMGGAAPKMGVTPYSGAFKPPGYNPAAPTWQGTNTYNLPKSPTMIGGSAQPAGPTMTMDTSPKPTGMTQTDPVSGLPIQPAGTQPTTINYNPPAPAMGVTQTYPQPWDDPNYQEPTPPPASAYAGQGAAMGIADQNRAGPAYGDLTKPSLPMPNNSTYAPPGFNAPYATPENVNQYMNPFLQSIMDRGNKALNWDPGTRPERQQATAENLAKFADPGYQFRLDQGMRALESGAAARGGLLSSGHMQDAINYSQNAASQEYANEFNRFNTAQDNAQNDWLGDRNFGSQQSQYGIGNAIGADATAYNAFNNDRNYMTDNNWKTYDRGYQANKDINAQNWDQYKYGNADYKGLLSDYYAGNNGIVNMGSNAANNAGTIQGNLGLALAELYGQAGNVGAQGAVNGGNANTGLLSSLLGALFSGFGG